jgi:hypothetical protein
MERGRIEFLDEDGSAVPLDHREDQWAAGPGGDRRGRWLMLALVAVVLAACGGVLWHQHSGSKQPASAPATAVTVAVGPQVGQILGDGVRPTGELLAEAERVQRQAQCMTRVQGELMQMVVAYRSAISAGGSVREAERAARAALADEPDGGGSGASYNAMLRIWRIDRVVLIKSTDGGFAITKPPAICP